MIDHERHAAARPTDTVRAWWRALQEKDVAALGTTLDDDYVSAGGPRGRTIGREAALEEAREFLRAGSVDTWAITDVVERIHGRVAVCSYAWQETGRHGATAFRLAGLATDVLLDHGRGRGWVIAAHHASLADRPGQSS